MEGGPSFPLIRKVFLKVTSKIKLSVDRSVFFDKYSVH